MMELKWLLDLHSSLTTVASHPQAQTHQVLMVGATTNPPSTPPSAQVHLPAVVAVAIALPLSVVLGIAAHRKYRFWQRQQKIKQLQRMWHGATESKKE